MTTGRINQVAALAGGTRGLRPTSPAARPPERGVFAVQCRTRAEPGTVSSVAHLTGSLEALTIRKLQAYGGSAFRKRPYNAVVASTETRWESQESRRLRQAARLRLHMRVFVQASHLRSPTAGSLRPD